MNNRRATVVAISIVVAGAAAGLVGGCILPASDCGFAGATCGASGGDASPGDGSVDQYVPPGCDPNVDIKCLTDEVGIFVEPGKSGTAGTRADHVGTLSAALGLVQGKRVNIFVCGDTLKEHVTVTKNVNIFGGFDCKFESGADLAKRVSVEGMSGKPTLDVSGVTLRVSGLRFVAADGADATAAGEAGGSSIAAWVHAGATVEAERTDFVSGKGGKAIAYSGDAMNGADGGPGANGSDGGAAGTSACGRDGGKGGLGGSIMPMDISSNGKPAPADGIDDGRRGCTRGASTDGCLGGGASACGNGGAGAAGVAAPMLPSAAAFVANANGLAVGAGASGNTGGHGGGGGGGGGGNAATQNGGGGGAGGCGGLGGKGGGAGGSSVGILVHDAVFRCVRACKMQPSMGGEGGRGQKGGPGGMGGNQGNNAAGGCDGGFGGGGAGGNGGNGGSAGLAIGLGFGGTAVVQWGATPITKDEATLADFVAAGNLEGTPGQGGDGGDPGPSAGNPGARGNAGNPGPMQPVLAAKKL